VQAPGRKAAILRLLEEMVEPKFTKAPEMPVPIDLDLPAVDGGDIPLPECMMELMCEISEEEPLLPDYGAQSLTARFLMQDPACPRPSTGAPRKALLRKPTAEMALLAQLPPSLRLWKGHVLTCQSVSLTPSHASSNVY
jgi:hypothetical protein